MRIQRLSICLLVVQMQLTISGSVRADVDLFEAMQNIAVSAISEGIGGAAGGAVLGKSEDVVAGAVAGAVGGGVKEAINYFRTGSTPGDSAALRRRIEEIASIAGKNDYFFRQLAARVDENVTKVEFEAQVRRLAAAIAESQAAEAEFRAQTQLTLRSQEHSISYLRARQDELRTEMAAISKRFENSLDRLRSETREQIAGLSSDLKSESADRRLVDQIQGNEITALRRIVDPVTRRQAASMLAAQGSELLLFNKDAQEAKKLLQLALSYDRHQGNKHSDPGIQYMLAIAYRRCGESARSEELLSDAIVAERFRRVPEWYGHISERLQGSDRLWLEDARRDARFGVRAPRDVVTTLDIEQSKEN